MEQSSASSSCSPETATYVTVHYDDGPETGLIAQVSEDDVCDPRYWRFQEVHGSPPTSKVLFPDGLTSFVVEKPLAAEGELIDEDGDRHSYVCEAMLPAAQEAPKENPPPLEQRRGRGGWGHVVLEKVEDEVLSSAGLAKRTAKRKPRRLAGMGHSSNHRPGMARYSRMRRMRSDAAEDSGKSGHRSKQPRTSGQKATESRVDADGSTSSAAAAVALEPAETAPADESSGGDLAANKQTDTTVEAPADAGTLLQEQPTSQPAATEATPPPTQTELTAASNAESSGGISACVNIERAKTARSICRSCGEGIDKNGVRCGMQGYAGGRSVMMWAHASCFLSHVSAEYVTARRGRCRGSSEPFEVGQLRVGFEVGSVKAWWLPLQAARWTSRVLSELADGGVPSFSVLGMDALDEEHRAPLMELLRTGKQPAIELRRAVPAAARRRAPSSGAKAKQLQGAEASEAPPPPAASAGNEDGSLEHLGPEASDSDVEMALDAADVGGKCAQAPAPLDLDLELEETTNSGASLTDQGGAGIATGVGGAEISEDEDFEIVVKTGSNSVTG